MKKLLVTFVALFLLWGALASHRACYPVRGLEIRVDRAPLSAGAIVETTAVSSGRGPVQVTLELEQGPHAEMLTLGRVPARAWAYWDPRPVTQTLSVTLSPDVLAAFQPGPAQLRAVAVGARAWLRQPPPVVSQRDVVIAPPAAPRAPGPPPGSAPRPWPP